jgi:catechol 2,3-dioxygenase-like lactoylglutathione lyase family enzyme
MERVEHLFAGVAVADFDRARAWYERLLGRPPDLVPHEREVAWRLTDTGWIYVVEDPDRRGGDLLTLLVDDLDRVVSDLAARGLAVGEIETIPDKVRRVAIEDPEGNRIAFGQTA